MKSSQLLKKEKGFGTIHYLLKKRMLNPKFVKVRFFLRRRIHRQITNATYKDIMISDIL